MSTIRSIELNHLTISAPILKVLPFDLMKRHLIIPFDLAQDRLCVAMSDPENAAVLNHVTALTGYEVDAFGADPQTIDRELERYFGSGEARPCNLELEALAGQQESAIPKVVQRLFELALKHRASDVHFESQPNGVFVRFRVDGVLHTIHQFPRTAAQQVLSRLKIMANMNIAEKRLPQDGQVGLKLEEKDIDLRISTMPAKYGEKMVVRVLQRSMHALELSKLGMGSITQTRFEALVERPQGLILVTGPTGSGKTTTLYSVISRIKSPLKNIITLEDPIEYELMAASPNDAGITQIQVNPRIDFTFASALRASLRQDPDVIMVGEIRDRETAEVAMKASMTGHIVLSTLHTNDTAQTIGRLRDIGIEPYLIASTVTGVLAQRLLRLLCTNCKETYSPPMRALKGLFPEFSEDKSISLCRPKGCHECQGTGYRDRIGIYELLTMTEQISALVHKNASVAEIKEFSEKQGLKSLRRSGLDLVYQGLTTLEEVFRHTV